MATLQNTQNYQVLIEAFEVLKYRLSVESTAMVLASFVSFCLLFCCFSSCSFLAFSFFCFSVIFLTIHHHQKMIPNINAKPMNEFKSNFFVPLLKI
jgi:hypothetical protein